MSTKKFTPIVAIAIVLAWTQPALTHDSENNPGQSQHGGQYVEYEVHHGIEMVAESSKLVFHMTEHLQPQDMKDSVFKVFVQTKTGTQTLPAKPDGSTLVAELSAPLTSGAKIVLTGKDDNGHTIQARFIQK